MPFLQFGRVSDNGLLLEGEPFTINIESVPLSGYNANAADALLPFGRACVAHPTISEGLTLPVDANSVFRGVVAHARAMENFPGVSYDVVNDVMGYPFNYRVGYFTSGVIGVVITQDMTELDPVYWIHTPDTGEKVGQFRKTANTNKAVLIPGARLRVGGKAGKVVPLSFEVR